ncbi:MAG: DUF6147 family protein [Lachnospiraceae bacterium]|nr:DUF6147 family protein [Lachnospiraceae bacterium]
MSVRKRRTSAVVVLLLSFSLLAIAPTDTQAAEGTKPTKELPMIDGSYLIKEEEAIGATTPMTRGEDLMTGYSKVRRLGAGEIYAGGTTIASHTVERIGVAVIVERAKEEDTSWSFYDSWQKFNENTDRVSTGKRMMVEGDYYYRVRCTHSAGNDLGSSFTDGIFVQP